jgi:nucleotide-binding universal stress UspA family protein
VPLAVVHAWTPDVPADHEAVCGSVAASQARAAEFLDHALAPWRRRFADVPVVPRLPIADRAAALIRESDGAALVVVGSRARGAVRGRLFGSVSRRVAQRARCPVIVVRTGKATAAERTESGRRTAVAGVDPGIEPVRRPRTPWE